MGNCFSQVACLCTCSFHIKLTFLKGAGREDTELQSTRGPATVYIALYNPTDNRDPRHWAIYINDPNGRESIQQLIDKKDIGEYRVDRIRYDIRPQRSGLWMENILCGSISSSRVDAARSLIQSQFVDNVSTTWNCQAWAMEALASLQQARLMTLDAGGQRRLASMRQNWQ